MKKNILNTVLLSALLSLVALSNCATDKGNPGDGDNTGNHANTPPENSPDAEYPGNRSDSTASAIDSARHHLGAQQ